MKIVVVAITKLEGMIEFSELTERTDLCLREDYSRLWC